MKGQFPLHTPIERNLSPRWFRSPQEDDDDEWAPSNMVPARDTRAAVAGDGCGIVMGEKSGAFGIGPRFAHGADDENHASRRSPSLRRVAWQLGL